jgi:hypothetical protein
VRTTILTLGEDLNALDVLHAALPQAVPKPNTDDGQFASEVLEKTLYFTPQRSLTLIFSPYAFAEGAEPTATPETVIRHLLEDRKPPGSVPLARCYGIGRSRDRNRRRSRCAGGCKGNVA